MTDPGNAAGVGLRAAFAVARRDLLEFVRDRRTLFITLLMPMAMYPVLALSSMLGARTALSDVLWNRLHEVHLESWTHRADGLAYALCEVFGPALQRGARISRRGEGLVARVPRSVSVSPRLAAP